MLRSVYLVTRRDYLGYVKAWGFWLGLMLTPVLMGVGMMVPTLAASQTPERHFTVIDPQGDFEDAVRVELADREVNLVRSIIEVSEAISGDGGAALERFDAAIEAGEPVETALESALPPPFTPQIPERNLVLVDPPARTVDTLRPYLSGARQIDGPNGPATLFAALIVTDNGVEYWSENVTVGDIKSLARSAALDTARNRVFQDAGINVGILDEIRAATPDLLEKRLRADGAAAAEVTLADRAPYWVSIALSFLLWTLIFSVVNYLLMGTIEERSNKIFDALLTSVKLPHLLAGKLIAVLAVSLTLMAVWSIGGGLITLFVSQSLPSAATDIVMEMAAAVLDPALLIPALLSFLLGYLMYGAIFLAFGSLCETIQEAQTLMTPLLVLLMVPLFMAIVAMNDPESPILAAMAWFPLFTPFLLILRMPTEPPLWEVLAQLGLMTLSTLAIIWLAALVYRAGAVHGAGVNDAASWLRRMGRQPAKTTP